MKITIPIAVSIPLNSDDHRLEIAITPDGLFGRIDNKQKGRSNRFAVFADDKGHKTTDIPNILLLQIGEVEVDADQLREVMDRGYAKTEESNLTHALKEGWKGARIRVQDSIMSHDWVQNVQSTGNVQWPAPPAPVVVAPVAPVAAVAPITAPVTLENIPLDPTAVLDPTDTSLEAALAVHDNQAAYSVPVAVETWEPVMFNGTVIDSFDYLDRCVKGKWNLAITGSTGCGKSALVYNYAVQRGMHHATIPFSEATDTTGLWDEPLLIPDGHGGTRSVRVLTAAGMVAKYGGIMEWQEVNGAADAMLTAIYGVLDFGRAITLSNGASIRLHPDTLIVATQNPVDASHTHASLMSAALDRRFWHVEMGYSEDIEAKIVPIKSLRELAKEIRNSGIQQPFGTDSLSKVHKAVGDFGLQQAMTGLVTMFREQSAREVVRPIVDVRLAELAKAYGEDIVSDVAELDAAELDF